MSSGSFVLAWVRLVAPRGSRVLSGSREFTTRGHRVHSDSRRFTQALLGIVGFFRVRVGSLRRIM